MSEESDAPKAPSLEEIKKQRIVELKKKIEEQKQYLTRMKEDKDEWKLCKLQVIALEKEPDGNNGLKESYNELKLMEDKCYAKYHVESITGLSSAIHNYETEIGNQEAKLQMLEGKYPAPQKGSKPQQGEEDNNTQQRIKSIAVPETGITTGEEKNNERAAPPDEQGQNQDTVLKVTFQSQRERLKQWFNSKSQEPPQQDRNRGGPER